MSVFRHLINDIIEIDSEKFDLELFLELEPEYLLPEGIVSREYISDEHHIMFTGETRCIGEFPWEDGDRYLKRVPDLHLLKKTVEEDIALINQIKNLKKDSPRPIKRTDIYPPTHDLVIALWEHFVEGKPKEDTINIVQEKRLRVKEKFPK